MNALRSELVAKDQEIVDIKKRVNALLQKEGAGGSGGGSAHFKGFFERQTNDLLYCKKIVAEYEKREHECTKRWNELLQENLHNAEKNASLKQQLAR